MWSFGCILAELHTGRWFFFLFLQVDDDDALISVGQPLFPGDNEAEQLLMYTEVIGIPEQSLIAVILNN